MVSCIRWREGNLTDLEKTQTSHQDETGMSVGIPSFARIVHHTDAVDMECEWAIFRASIVEASAESFGQKVTRARLGGNLRTCR